MKQPCQYLVVDDDNTSNLICKFTIQRLSKETPATLFTSPESALEYIRTEKPCQGITILFLDVNMPTMSGFEFLTEFEKFCPDIKKHFRVYMLTSSIEDFSAQAKEYTMVNGFLSKPMKVSYLEKITAEMANDVECDREKIEN